MAINIARALNIEKHERGVVMLLLAQSIFLGIFAGSLDVGANALFLDAYSADKMPGAFMISGAVGIFLTSLYTFLQNKIPFKTFTILNLLVAIILTGLLRLGYELYEDPRLAFVLLVMMGPIIIVTMLGFWGTAGRFFSLREGKRLFGIIDTGSIVGMVIAFYSVPVLMNFQFQTKDTLLIGFISLFIALLFQGVVLKRHKLLSINVDTDSIIKKTGVFNLFRRRYTSLMAVFIILSVVTAFFIHYSFMWATEANYSDNRELTSFIGAFFGTMMIFTVILKGTLYSWLMKNYGVRITLLISPVLLLVLTLIASIVGGIFGYTAEAASFTLFFLVIALSKLFNKSLKDSMESPSMKILYQSLDSSERFDVQAKIDGIINEFTAFAAGLIMAGLLYLSFINVIHFSYLLIIILVIWVVIGYALYSSYRKNLNDSLVKVKSSMQNASLTDQPSSDSLSTISSMASDLIKTDPYFFHETPLEEVEALLGSDNKKNKWITWKHVENILYLPKENTFRKVELSDDSAELKNLVSTIMNRIDNSNVDPVHSFRSGNKENIFKALHYIIRQNNKQYLPNIIALLRDRDLTVRSAAIDAAGKIKAVELGAYLVDYLGHKELYAVSWSALVNMGAGVLENLENAFHKTGVDVKVMLRIVKAMDKIGGKKAQNYLFQKIDYHQREIREAAIEALFRTDFSPDEREKAKLRDVIYEASLAGAVNVATEATIKENDPGNGILSAIEEEKWRTDQLIFMLLGICYDKHAIGHVKQSLTGADSADSGYALELMNMLIDDEVFAYLEAYFDDIPVYEKIRRLQNEMPVEVLQYEKLLIDIMNRDSLYTGNYLRICAIDAIGKHDQIDAAKYLAAQLFHPHPAISGAASVVLGKKDASLYADVIERIDSKLINNEGQSVFRGQFTTQRSLQFVENFKKWKLFNELSREELLKLIQIINPVNDQDAFKKGIVSFIRRDTTDDNILHSGILIILDDYPELSEHIKYLATLPGLEFYQADIIKIRELLFDVEPLRKCFKRFFQSPESNAIAELKVK